MNFKITNRLSKCKKTHFKCLSEQIIYFKNLKTNGMICSITTKDNSLFAANSSNTRNPIIIHCNFILKLLRSTRRRRPSNPTYWDGALARICSSSPMMLEERWDYSLRGLTAFISRKAEAVLVVLSIRRVVSECSIVGQD